MPIAAVQGISLWLSNLAYLYLSVSLVQMIKAMFLDSMQIYYFLIWLSIGFGVALAGLMPQAQSDGSGAQLHSVTLPGRHFCVGNRALPLRAFAARNRPRTNHNTTRQQNGVQMQTARTTVYRRLWHGATTPLTTRAPRRSSRSHGS